MGCEAIPGNCPGNIPGCCMFGIGCGAPLLALVFGICICEKSGMNGAPADTGACFMPICPNAEPYC